MKKVGFVAASAIGLSVIFGGTAQAAPAENNVDVPSGDEITYADAFHQFNEGGGAAGYGAASLVSSAYTGIALTPALIAGSFDN